MPSIDDYRPFLFVPALAVIGAANNQRDWLGAIVGGLVGLFFALAATGLMPAGIVGAIIPGEPIKEEVDDSV